MATWVGCTAGAAKLSGAAEAVCAVAAKAEKPTAAVPAVAEPNEEPNTWWDESNTDRAGVDPKADAVKAENGLVDALLPNTEVRGDESVVERNEGKEGVAPLPNEKDGEAIAEEEEAVEKGAAEVGVMAVSPAAAGRLACCPSADDGEATALRLSVLGGEDTDGIEVAAAVAGAGEAAAAVAAG